MPGYFRDPQATADVMRDGGWYASGDLGELHGDGALFIVGRLKEMIIRSGFNVYPGEVEQALNRFPASGTRLSSASAKRTATRPSSRSSNWTAAGRWTKPRCAGICANSSRRTSIRAASLPSTHCRSTATAS